METILVVEDEQASLELLAEILTAEGYRVRPADSGKLAFASLAAGSPDLILADVRMPVMDGFEFCRRLKSRKESAAIPLIFISASSDTTARVRGLALGAVDFLSKPLQKEELLARVRTHLELSRLRGNLEAEVTRRTADLHSALVQLKREVAERAMAEQALRESEERFRNMADTAPVLIWVSGPDKLCTFLNKSWLNFTGRTMEQEVGDGWAETVHPDDLDRCISTYRAAFDDRRPFRMEYRLRRSDGEYRWVIDEGAPRIEPGGRFLGYVGSCIDVTDVRQAKEEALGRERVESLRVLAGGIAHDFTNLMTNVLASADLAEAEIEAGSPAGEDVRNIRMAAMQAVDMARELMMYAGQDKGNFERIDLSRLVKDMTEIVRPSISKRAVLTCDLPEDLPPIWGNPTHIRQIVMNLIINASEAVNDRSGAIHVRTSRVRDVQPAGSKSGPAVQNGPRVRLEVSDEGCGMTNEQRSRIFDPLFTTKGVGHGLGLAVVQEIVHSHGGVINVTSAPGQGTTFEILLPCVQSHTENLADHAFSVSDDDSYCHLRESQQPFARGGATVKGQCRSPAERAIPREHRQS
jgi:PAS domain S-box-containing protein